MQINVKFEANMPICVKEENNWYIASAPIFDVHSQGKSRKEAVGNLGEALTLFFSSCFERGTLDEVLKQCGFVFAGTKIKPPQKSVPSTDTIKVPFYLVADKADQTKEVECHV